MSYAITLSNEAITRRVADSNRFTKAEMEGNRKAIALARKNRRQSLKAMSHNEQDALIAMHRQNGFNRIVSDKGTQLKSGVLRRTIVLEQVKEDPRDKEIRELREQLNRLMGKVEHEIIEA